MTAPTKPTCPTCGSEEPKVRNPIPRVAVPVARYDCDNSTFHDAPVETEENALLKSGTFPTVPTPPTAGALDERMNLLMQVKCAMRWDETYALGLLIAAERADAERVQRERAERAEKKGACACDTAGMSMAVVCERHALLLDAATRPYRMAIARWWVSMPVWIRRTARPPTHLSKSMAAEDELRSLITDADIEAARKENPDVR